MHRAKWRLILDRVRTRLPSRTKTSDGATWWNYQGHQYRYRPAQSDGSSFVDHSDGETGNKDG